MPNEIAVRSNIAFLSDDGTTYSSDYQYNSDATATASGAKRYTFYAAPTQQDILSTGATTAFVQGLQGPGILMLCNRSTNVTMDVELSGFGPVTLNRSLAPGDSMIMDVMEFDQAALGGGGSFTYASTPVTNVYVQTELQEARGELVFISKSTS